MLALYGVYIAIMANNERLKEMATNLLASHPFTANLLGSGVLSSVDGPDDVFGSSSSATVGAASKKGAENGLEMGRKQTKIEDDSMYLAALLIIIKHKRLFRTTIRFQSAARYVIIKMQHKAQQQKQQLAGHKKQLDEADYFESNPLRGDAEAGKRVRGSQRAKMEAYAHEGSMSKNKFSIVSRDEYEIWNVPPGEGESECCLLPPH